MIYCTLAVLAQGCQPGWFKQAAMARNSRRRGGNSQGRGKGDRSQTEAWESCDLCQCMIGFFRCFARGRKRWKRSATRWAPSTRPSCSRPGYPVTLLPCCRLRPCVIVRRGVVRRQKEKPSRGGRGSGRGNKGGARRRNAGRTNAGPLPASVQTEASGLDGIPMRVVMFGWPVLAKLYRSAPDAAAFVRRRWDVSAL